MIDLNELEELALLKELVVELLQTRLNVLVQGVNAGNIEGTLPLLVSDVFVEKASSVDVGRSLASLFLLLSVESADGNEPKATTV